jgi:hypothetical protein
MTTDALLACRPMNAPRAARRIALALTLMVAGWGCSGSTRKDQFYGTDVGVNWIPADATAPDAAGDARVQDASSVEEAGTDAGAALDAGADALDAGASADAPAGDI